MIYKSRFKEAYAENIENKIVKKGYAWVKSGKSYSLYSHYTDNKGYWVIDESGDLDYEVYPSKIIKTKNDNIINSKMFYICFFGDNYRQNYEYGSLSTSESELYSVMRNWDMQEGVLGKYNTQTGKVKYFIVYPFDDGR